MKAVRAYIGLGANLGDPRSALEAALKALAELPDTRLVKVSSFYRSAPVDSSGPDYVNAVAELQTQLSPHDLLLKLQAIESRHGRERPYRNAPRTLDLDLLMYGDETLQSVDLTVPHPRLHERAFVVLPLAEIAPGLRVPGRGSVDDMVAAIAGQRIERMIA